MRVFEAARELGYLPNRAAKALASGKTQMIALWSPPSYSSFYASILYHLQRLARESGYDMIYRHVVFDPAQASVNLKSLAWPVDGVIAVDSRYILDHLAESPELIGRPLIGIGAYSAPAFDCVTVDLEAGAREALEHLLETGRERIAFLRPLNPIDTNDPRTSAYLYFCHQKKLKPQVIEVDSFDREETRKVVHKLASEGGLPDAIFCYNDHSALAVMRGIKDAGLNVPEDCAVVGCDGTNDSEFFDPSLTTVVQPVQKMCEQGWDQLLDRLNNPAAPLKSSVLKPTLAIRQSSQPRTKSR